MTAMERPHLTSTAMTAETSVVSSGETSVLGTQPSASTLVGMALEELRKFGRLKSFKASALSAVDLRGVCESIRQDVLAEIEAGNSVFKGDELEVAFNLELQKFGLQKTYQKLLDVAHSHTSGDVHSGTNGDGKEEIDRSTIGFSKMEVKRIPKSAREMINLRFSQMTIQGRARRKAQEISE